MNWLKVFILKTLARLPPSIGLAVGSIIGRMLFIALSERRRVTEINLRHCFPRLDGNELLTLTKQVFIENGRGVVETAWAWYSDHGQLLDRVTYNDSQILSEALSSGSVLLCCPHVTMLDLCAPILNGKFGEFVITYRPHKKQWLEQEIIRNRGRYGKLVNVRSMREIVSALRTPGNLVWMAPDQDLGLEGTTTAKFFNQASSTVTSPGRLAKSTNCRVFMMYLYRVEEEYFVGFWEFPENFPSGVQEEDARILNEELRSSIMKSPSQYLWLHRRFKSVKDEQGLSIYDIH